MRKRYREVIIFTAGQMKDPRPLVQHVYEMQVEHPSSIDTDLFKSLHAESTVRLVDDPLRNKYINYYNHRLDEEKKRPLDTTRVYWPSRVYHFNWMEHEVVLDHHTEGEEIPPCTMYISQPDEAVSDSLLSICSEISKHQAVINLWMLGVTSNSLEAPRLSRNSRSLNIYSCNLSSSFTRKVLQQLHNCVTLTFLDLHQMDLREVEEDLDHLLSNLVANHEKGLSQKGLRIQIEKNGLSEGFVAKWRRRCEGITSINCNIGC